MSMWSLKHSVRCVGHQSTESKDGVVVESAAGEIKSFQQITKDKLSGLESHMKNQFVSEFDPRVKFSSGDHSKGTSANSVEILTAGEFLPHGSMGMMETEAVGKERFFSGVELVSEFELQEKLSTYSGLKRDNLVDSTFEELGSTISDEMQSLPASDSIAKYSHDDVQLTSEQKQSVAERSKDTREKENRDDVRTPMHDIKIDLHVHRAIVSNEDLNNQQPDHDYEEVKDNREGVKAADESISDENDEEDEEDDDDSYEDEEDDDNEDTEDTDSDDLDSEEKYNSQLVKDDVFEQSYTEDYSTTAESPSANREHDKFISADEHLEFHDSIHPLYQVPVMTSHDEESGRESRHTLRNEELMESNSSSVLLQEPEDWRSGDQLQLPTGDSDAYYYAVEDPLEQIPPDNLEFILAASGTGIGKVDNSWDNKQPDLADNGGPFISGHMNDEAKDQSSLHVDDSHSVGRDEQMDSHLVITDLENKKVGYGDELNKKLEEVDDHYVSKHDEYTNEGGVLSDSSGSSSLYQTEKLGRLASYSSGKGSTVESNSVVNHNVVDDVHHHPPSHDNERHFSEAAKELSGKHQGDVRDMRRPSEVSMQNVESPAENSDVESEKTRGCR
jgi:hypothetical protein